MDVPGLLDDPEAPRAPVEHPVVDAHVHLFPDRLFEALWGWFDRHAWPIRYRLRSEQVIEFLATRGVDRVVGLHYAHKPGIAADLNRYVLDLARRFPQVIPTATVFPGERGARDLLRRALGEGARGVKIHCHVQKIAPDDPRLDEVFEEAAAAAVPVVMHAGREPASDAYGVDTRALCSVDAVDRVLARHPGLTLVVPHLGADEFDEYEALLDRHPRLFLDTTMAIARYLPGGPDLSVLARRADRLLYGSDFPDLPYAWSRELTVVRDAGLSPGQARALLGATARRLFLPP
ncbi:MAG: amidohydrolase [Planctomycetes bacterium]|nr:amidohydrolase [Planctomycetota bacterium]